MKRLFSICLVLALSLGFVACKEPQNNEPNKEQTGENNGGETGENNNGENNGEGENNEDVVTSPIVGVWHNFQDNGETTREQIYTFNADGKGTYYTLTVHPEYGGTALTESTEYIYKPDAQELIITYIISGWRDTQTYTAILEGDSLTISNDNTPETTYTRQVE